MDACLRHFCRVEKILGRYVELYIEYQLDYPQRAILKLGRFMLMLYENLSMPLIQGRGAP